MQYNLVNAKDIPNCPEMTASVLMQAYPKFLTHNLSDNPVWVSLFDLYPEFQLVLVETSTKSAIAQVSCLPLAWQENLEKLPAQGCDWVCAKSITDSLEGRKPNILAVVSLSIIPEYQGKRLSCPLLEHCQKIAQTHQFRSLILAARPSLKHLYPLIPMERYITWKNDQGLLFDPWLRFNVKQGASLLGVCAESTTIVDTIDTWEIMANMYFPETGDYVIPGGLVPLEIDYTHQQGTYIEPNIWLSYQLV
jgi:hypothetical protein